MNSIYSQQFNFGFSSFITMLALAFLFLFNQKLIAQPANCDNPGNFQIVPPDGASGDGSSNNPFIVCEDEELQFISEGVSSTLGLPNPGLVFLVYYQNPTNVDPEDEDQMVTTLVAFSDSDGNFIIDNGAGAFISTGLTDFGPPWITDEGPDTICIVPIIVPDVTNPSSFNMDCTGIDPSIDYPKVVIVDPEVYPNCTLDPIEDCLTEVITQIDPDAVPTEFCEATVVDLTEWENAVTTDLDESAVFTWLNEDGIPLANPSSVSLSTEGCDIASYIFSLEVDCATDEDLNLAAGSVSFTVYPEIEGNFTLPDLESCEATISLDCPDFEVLYSIDGSTTSEIPPTIEQGEALTFQYIVGLEDCQILGTYTINCPESPCIAESGTPNFDDFNDLVCGSVSINASSTGFQLAELYTQNYVLTDGDFDIIESNVSGEFDLGPGTYVVHALNWAFTNDPLLVVGENALEILEGVDCFDIVSSDEIAVVDDLQADLSFSCDETFGAIVTLEVFGGYPAFNSNGLYEVSGDYTGMLTPLDVPLDLFGDNNTDVEYTITDLAGCSVTLNGTTLNCDTMDVCEAEAGSFVGLEEFYCNDAEIVSEIAGANLDAIFTQAFVLTDTNLNIIATSFDGLFTPEPGTYLVHSLNVLTSEADPLFDDLTGLNAADVLVLLDCFDIETSNPLVVLTPIDYVLETECDDSGTATAVFTFTGGLPQYAFENQGTTSPDAFFYDVSGFISGEFTVEDQFITNTLENQLFELEIVDFANCSLSVSDTIPCSLKNCDAEVGILNQFADTLCTDQMLDVSTNGFNMSGDFEQFYLLADDALNISIVSVDGLFENLDAGSYTVFGLNTDGGLSSGDYLGLSITEIDSSLLLCFDLAFLGDLNVSDCSLDPIVIGPVDYVVDTMENTYVATFEISGGSGIYTVSPGNLDGNIYTSDSVACGTDLVITISDDEGNTIEIELDAPCEEENPDCPGLAEGGTLMGAEAFYCDGSPLLVSADGFNDTPDYTQLFVVTQGENFIIEAVSTNGDFGVLPSGTYEVHTFNYFNDMPPSIPVDPIGTSAVDIVTQTEACFDLDPSEAVTINVLEPIVIDVDYDCDGNTGVYTLTFGFVGGLPSFADDNGSGNPDDFFYDLDGDIDGQFSLAENNQTQAYLDNSPYELSITDNANCEASIAGTPQACIKTSIELFDFDGEILNEGNLLFWSTASEIDNDYFVVEKSFDGVTFYAISEIQSIGNSNAVQRYEWLDSEKFAGISYYRLAIVDVYGDKSYSSVIRLVRDQTLLAISSIAPNPTSGNTSLQFYASEGSTSILVYDVMGKILVDKTIRTSVGLNEYQLESNNWVSGMYLVVLSNENIQVQKRLIKE